MKNYSYLEALKESILIFDGAMGTNLQALKLQAADFGGERYAGCNDVLCLARPSAIEQIHRSFLEVGVDVIETNTFRSNRITLSEYGLEDEVFPINTQAARLAKRLAKTYSTSGQPRFVAGSIGPSGKILSIDENQSAPVTFPTLVDVFKEQALALLEGEVDLLLLETQQDLLEVKAAILGIHKACQESDRYVPIQTQVSMDTHNHMLLGSSIDAVSATLEALEIDVLGLNCSTGPDEMEPAIAFLGKNASLPISCLPNAGMPEMSGDEVIYPLNPEHFAQQLAHFVAKHGASAVGGCCGTTPEHLRLLVEKVHDYPAPHKQKSQGSFLSSPLHAQAIRQSPPPFIIGERLNTQGSRNFKNIILAGDFAQAETLAQQQVENGAHGLDVCTALTENDLEKQNMVTLIRRISHTLDAPLIIDTTNPLVMEAALQSTPGRCLLNSTNFESGETKARNTFTLARQYGAAVLVLTIDEHGMAKSIEDKLAIVERAYQMAVNEVQLSPQSLVFDPLTFSLASGDEGTLNSAVVTLSAIHAIKQRYPNCHVSLGISNISYGFSTPARKILNSVFLYHALQAGLDMAILNAADLVPYTEISADEKEVTERLIFHHSAQALTDFIAIFTEAKRSHAEAEGPSIPTRMQPGEKVHRHITNRTRDGLEEDIVQYIQEKSRQRSPQHAAFSLLNEHLLPAMKEVGEQFSNGEIILPFVLQSSEIMRAATTKLEEYIQRQEQEEMGRVLLATVYGDVHDIGKNLVRTILENNGYSVIDLGKQVPAEQIVETALDKNVTAIGLSALLVNTSQQMPLVVEKLRAQHSNIPLLIGGAAVNQTFAKRIEKDERGAVYAGGVFYCKDAFDALTILGGLQKSRKEIQ